MSPPETSSSGTAAKDPPPKGPVGVSFVPLPVPIASTLPPPSSIEPLANLNHSDREALAIAATERRRELTEAGQVLNRVVYDSQVFVPGSADRVPGGGLLFESRFESGNLRRAVHVNGNEYDLLLNWDHGTRGHTQWFFFSVAAAHVGEKYIFNIVNFCKPQSLYKNGMRPLVYSAAAATKLGHGWARCGHDVFYHENGVARRDKARARDANKGDLSHSTLSFSWTAEYPSDTLYFAMCYPYTYTDLRAYLARIQADPLRARHVRRQRLALTIAGNECEMLWVTDHASPAEAVNARPVVALSARVHPGESNASWVMQGIIDFITGRSAEADALRRHCLFLIVPMLNPDGVICGNYRCSLAAVDLNRRWQRPSSKLHPTVHALKKLLLRLHVRQPVAVYVDLHGHSRKQRVFMYGCEEPGSVRQRAGVPSSISSTLLQQVFPLLVSRVCGTNGGTNGNEGGKRTTDNFFSFGSCNYAIKKSKECTARVVVHRELGLVTSYTLEASFCGCDERRMKNVEPEPAPATGENGETNGESSHAPAPAVETGLGGGFHFSSSHLMQIGCRFCRALHVYFGLGAPPSDSSIKDEVGGLSISQIDGVNQLPNNPSIHAALVELVHGDVDVGPEGDSEGSDGGDASGEENEDKHIAPTPAPACKVNGRDTAGSQGRVAAPPQPPRKEVADRNRRNSISTRRTREAEMRAAAQRAEAAAAAAAALLGNRPDLLVGPSLPQAQRSMHHGGGARPDNPMPPPPLIQQPSVTLMQQQREAQDRIERTALYQAQHPALFHPGSQQQPGLLPRDPRELGGGSAPTGLGGLLPARDGRNAAGSCHGHDGDDETEYDEGDGSNMSRDASFARGRGFTGKSLSLRSTQWAARPRPTQPILTSQQGLAPQGPPQGPPRLLSGSGERPRGDGARCAPQSPATGQHGLTAPPSAAPSKTGTQLLKRRPQLPSCDPEEVGAPSAPGHSTPFAELIARRGSEGLPGNGHAERLGAGGSAGSPCPPALDGNGNTEHGMVAGLEMLVSHVRRTAGSDRSGSGDGEGGFDVAVHPGAGAGLAHRNKSSPVAGRRALPPSATAMAAPHLDDLAPAEPSHDGLNATEVDDAIYSLAASLRAPRHAHHRGLGDGDDEHMCYNSMGVATEGASPSAAAMGRLPGAGAPSLAMPPPGYPPQPLSAAGRQRWSAREGDRPPPSHSPHGLSSGKEYGGAAGGGGAAAQSLTGNGSWPPRTWHSHGLPGSRPRSVEGGPRPLEAQRGLPSTRRAAYYSQPPSDPRLVLQPTGTPTNYYS